MGNDKIWKIDDNFHKNLDWRAKIIINFSDLCIFPIFIIFIFKLDANFPSLQLKFLYFLILFLFLVLFVKK